MVSINILSEDPNWLPHRLDRASGEIELVKVTKGRFAQAPFLADHTPQSESDLARISSDAFVSEHVEQGPAHFIFHTAFCRSTLLVRALNIPGHCTGMSEPGIIASLTGVAGDKSAQGGARLIAPAIAWLSRSHANSKAVFIKPTNHANALMPALMQVKPDARAILISNSLQDFLSAVNRRGLLGRQWARKLYLEVQAYAPLDLGMDGPNQFALSDMQTAGLAWLLQRRWMLMVMEHVGKDRFASIDSGVFDARREQTLLAVSEFANVPLSMKEASAAAQSTIFTSHSKLGGDFVARQQDEKARSQSAIWDEEASQVEQWIEAIAQQAGIPKTLPQQLL